MLDYLYFIVIICRVSPVAGCTDSWLMLDYLYFIVIICRVSSVAGCTDHGCEAGLSVQTMAVKLDYLYFIVIFPGSHLWQAVQTMAVKLDYLYFIVISPGSQLWQAVQAMAEAGLSVLHCDNLQGVSCGRLYRPWL